MTNAADLKQNVIPCSKFHVMDFL